MITTTSDRHIAILIERCAQRAARQLGLHVKQDLTLAHLNGCALDLLRLHQSRLSQFSRDVHGIVKHLDRTTGKVIGFTPECAAP